HEIHLLLSLPSLSLRIRPPPRSPLFPYTTLFRSEHAVQVQVEAGEEVARAEAEARRQDADASPSVCRDEVRRIPSGRRRGYDERSEEHTSELQSRGHLVCRLLLEKKKRNSIKRNN